MILMAFGTRPEYIKIKPLIKEMQGKIPFKLLFTGQHVDLLANVEDQDVIKLDIQDGSNRLDSIVFFDYESGSHF
jgi:UDP-N-acetylglucosamine 2-epimerase